MKEDSKSICELVFPLSYWKVGKSNIFFPVHFGFSYTLRKYESPSIKDIKTQLCDPLSIANASDCQSSIRYWKEQSSLSYK